MHRKIIFSLVALVSIHHIIATGLYLLPNNPMTNYYRKYVTKYMHPFFFQQWGLFAPEPSTYSTRMYYRCQKEKGEWGQWKDPISSLIRSHQENRFSYRGKLVYVYQGLFRSLANAKNNLIKYHCGVKVSQCHMDAKKLVELREYQRVNKLVSDLCQKEDMRRGGEFSLVRVYPKNFSKRKSKNNNNKMDIDRYPRS